MSRDDLVQICGPADGIRLFNAIKGRCVSLSSCRCGVATCMPPCAPAGGDRAPLGTGAGGEGIGVGAELTLPGGPSPFSPFFVLFCFCFFCFYSFGFSPRSLGSGFQPLSLSLGAQPLARPGLPAWPPRGRRGLATWPRATVLSSGRTGERGRGRGSYVPGWTWSGVCCSRQPQPWSLPNATDRVTFKFHLIFTREQHSFRVRERAWV